MTNEPETGDRVRVAGTHRRRFIGKGLLAFVAGLLWRRSPTAEARPPTPASRARRGRLVTEGEVLRTNVYQGRPPIEPLDTMIRLERSDDNNGRAITHEILSLMHEEKGKRSYPWTIYSHLTTHHVEGDACVLCSRLHKKDAGWSAGLHSEVFSSARGVALGVNVEMSNEYTGSDETMIVGIHVQAKGPRDCQYGLEMHDGGGHFEKAIGLNGKSRVGLDVAGDYGIGIHTHDNSIRLNEGASIELDGVGKVCLRYRAGRIEFMNGERCVGHIDANGEDHRL